MVTIVKQGAGTRYQFTPRVSAGIAGLFRVSERFYPTLDKRFDAEFHLGIIMSHAVSNQDVVNSFCWRGFSSYGKLINSLFIKDIFLSIDEPQSILNSYTDIQIAASDVDFTKAVMPDLSFEGILAHGWLRNFYFANAADDATQNKLEVWNGAALLDMNNYLYGAVHNRSAGFVWQTPKHYSYDNLPITKPIVFYHRTNNYTTNQHSAYGLIKVVANVKWFASNKKTLHDAL